MSLEIQVKQNTQAINKLLEQAKNISELPLFEDVFSEGDLFLFYITSLDQTVAIEYSRLIQAIASANIDLTDYLKTGDYQGTAQDLKDEIDVNADNFQYYILISEKGQPQGVATLDANQKLTSSQLPDLAITDVILATETTIADFATNSGNYTFEQGDVIIIDDNGSLTHYIYKGGSKTDVNEYSEISASEIDISQVNGLQDALDLKANDSEVVKGISDSSLYLDPATQLIRANVSTYSQTLSKAGSQIFTLDFEPTNFLMLHVRVALFDSDYIFTPPTTLEIIPEMAEGEKLRIVYEHFITQP